MKIVVLDTNFEQVKPIDTFISFIWTDRYSEYGDFELCFSMDPALLNYLKEDYYLWLDESEHLMILEEIAVNSDTEDGDQLIVTGRSLESILDRRIVWGQKDFTGNLQNGVKTLLEESIISPQIEERKISNFVFEESLDPKVTELVIDAQYTGEDLYSVIKTLCETNRIGFKIILNDNNQFVFSLYAGTDRSYEQSTNPYVIFSPNYDNIINSNYFTSKKEFKNVALVVGEGDDWASKKKITVGTASGLGRREMYTDGSGVTSEVDGKTLTDAEYSAKLREKGQADLSDHPVKSAFESEVDATHMYKYGEDFFVGDIVQVANEYGHEGAAYVSELIISQDDKGLSLYPTFKSIQDNDGKPNLSSKFYISHGSAYYTYSFVSGWTWQDFVNSEYNDGKISVTETEVKFKDENTIFSETPTSEIIEGATYHATVSTYIYEPGYTSYLNVESVHVNNAYDTFTSEHVQINNYYGSGFFDDPSAIHGCVSLYADFTKYNKLVIKGKRLYMSTGEYTGATVGYSSKKPIYNQHISYIDRDNINPNRSGESVCEFDISDVTGFRYIIIEITTAKKAAVAITEIHFEE